MNISCNDVQPKILFVDDEKAILKSMERFGRVQSWSVSVAESGEEALSLLAEDQYDVIVSDMRMPNMSGSEFLKRAKALQPEATRVLLSGYSDIESVREAVNDASIFNYVTKPWEPEAFSQVIQAAAAHKCEAVEREFIAKKTKDESVTLGKVALLMDKKAKERNIEVEQAMALMQSMQVQSELRLKESVNVLNQIVDWKEGRDASHTRFVSKYAEKIAAYLKLGDSEIQEISIAAMLHRIGLIGMPDSLGVEPYYRLTQDERAQFDRYPLLGETALIQSQNLKGAAKIIRHHKECVNGTGFPDGLNYKEIPLGSLIIGLLSDFFEVCLGRVEKNIAGIENGTEYVRRWIDKKYDRRVFEAFLAVFDNDCDELRGISVLSSGALTEGMVLEQDVYSKAGALMLAKNTAITQSILQSILGFEQKGDEYMVRVSVCKNKNTAE